MKTVLLYSVLGFCLVFTAVLAAQTFTDQELKSLFYADLGPDTINVSSYPKKQQEEYPVFAKTCSQCHTLARAINSPTVSRQAWEYYVIKMRMWMEPGHHPRYTREQAQQILDFLVYDSKTRKIGRREDFDAMTRRLQIRFEKSIDERIRRMRFAPHSPGIEHLE